MKRTKTLLLQLSLQLQVWMDDILDGIKATFNSLVSFRWIL